ncbi:hypothetical protein ABTZ99_20330 [Actinosynnema sp. NPDC002837]
MSLFDIADNVREVFGVPTVLTGQESATLMRGLIELWRLTYGKSPGRIEEDLEGCRRFFDPVARGHTLRERLSNLPQTPAELRRMPYGEPLLVDAGDKTLIIGVEGRLIIALLERQDLSKGHLVFPSTEVSSVEKKALQVYRGWSRGRLNQVIALQSGRGTEVLQAISVGLVIALLANRSDSPARAVIRWDHYTPEGEQIDKAIHAGAERFASVISGSRGGRSAGEQRLKGGYALSEARRRLAHRLAVEHDNRSEGERLYVPAEHRDEVIRFLANDLARRPSLSQEKLALAFDQLVSEFRSIAGQLAHRSMVFERAADTQTLKQHLIEIFSSARQQGSP